MHFSIVNDSAKFFLVHSNAFSNSLLTVETTESFHSSIALEIDHRLTSDNAPHSRVRFGFSSGTWCQLRCPRAGFVLICKYRGNSKINNNDHRTYFRCWHTHTHSECGDCERRVNERSSGRFTSNRTDKIRTIVTRPVAGRRAPRSPSTLIIIIPDYNDRLNCSAILIIVKSNEHQHSSARHTYATVQAVLSFSF